VSAMNTIKANRTLLAWAATVTAALVLGAAWAAAPGITGPTFNLDASAAYITQPDGSSIYSWGYGCASPPTGYLPTGDAALPGASCQTMQLPGPTLIVYENDVVTVNLTNGLPARAGNTSIMFPGFTVTATGNAPVVPGQLTAEAAPGGSASYTFTASKPGTHSYYSGTQSDLQVEMGLYGTIIVLPTAVPAGCTGLGLIPAHYIDTVAGNTQEVDYRLAASAYDHVASCYDREYLFQFSEIDPNIHRAAEEIVNCTVGPGVPTCPANMDTVATEPYHAAYFLINGRSMPDDMDPIYSVQYPHQPYNGNPHMHPGELTLLRIVGQGRMQHPFHEHGNHVRVLARDGNLLLAPDLLPGATTPLAGPLMFTTTTTPGQTIDGIFQWTGKGLNWDVFGHGYSGDTSTCTPDANGYNNAVAAPNYYEWCGDHRKALENKPFGRVGAGGPINLPDPNILTNGPWYSGSPYMSAEATGRATGATPIPPSGTVANDPTGEAGFAYMWHSHNEREITTNNIFPGGMLMMMLVDPRAYSIDESK